MRRYERREVLVSDGFSRKTLARYGHACSLPDIEAEQYTQRPAPIQRWNNFVAGHETSIE
jgi:hypothetical protein